MKRRRRRKHEEEETEESSPVGTTSAHVAAIATCSMSSMQCCKRPRLGSALAQHTAAHSAPRRRIGLRAWALRLALCISCTPKVSPSTREVLSRKP